MDPQLSCVPLWGFELSSCKCCFLWMLLTSQSIRVITTCMCVCCKSSAYPSRGSHIYLAHWNISDHDQNEIKWSRPVLETIKRQDDFGASLSRIKISFWQIKWLSSLLFLCVMHCYLTPVSFPTLFSWAGTVQPDTMWGRAQKKLDLPPCFVRNMYTEVVSWLGMLLCSCMIEWVLVLRNIACQWFSS